jgi:malate dehydrogenase (oxaloacetate-decarboxylating)
MALKSFPTIFSAFSSAAAKAIAELVTADRLSEDFIVPDAFDPAVGPAVGKAVAEAARISKVARL